MILTEKALLGVSLGLGALALTAAAVVQLVDANREVAAECDLLASILAKHSDVLDDTDRMNLRELGVAIKEISVG